MISEEEAYEQALRLHPELMRWSERDYERAERRDGVNWRVHLYLDAAVLRRMSDRALPDASVVKALRQRGSSKREAVHEIGRLLTEAIWSKLAAQEIEQGRARADDFKEAVRDWPNKELDEAIRALAQ